METARSAADYLDKIKDIAEVLLMSEDDDNKEATGLAVEHTLKELDYYIDEMEENGESVLVIMLFIDLLQLLREKDERNCFGP